MNWLEYLRALILGAVEGITEFLPISSTGHLIITADLIGFQGPLSDTFKIAIQLGAILAICWLYRDRVMNVLRGLGSRPEAQRFSVNILIAFLPAAILGLLFHEIITEVLFSPRSVAIALIVGGMVILAVERMHIPVRIGNVDDMRWTDALKIGLVQTLALIPGTSRAGATIIGGLVFGLSRPVATEFSFFLAMPTMLAATAYSIYKDVDRFTADEMGIFAIGFCTAFAFALLAVRTLVRYVANHDFTAFAWYRILFGSLVLWYFWSWGPSNSV